MKDYLIVKNTIMTETFDPMKINQLHEEALVENEKRNKEKMLENMSVEEYVGKIKENIDSELITSLVDVEKEYASKRHFEEGKSLVKELAIDIIVNKGDELAQTVEKMIEEPWLFQAFQERRIKENLVNPSGDGGLGFENASEFIFILTYSYGLKDINDNDKKRDFLENYIDNDDKYGAKDGRLLLAEDEEEKTVYVVVKNEDGSLDLESPIASGDEEWIIESGRKDSGIFNHLTLPTAIAKYMQEYFSAVDNAKLIKEGYELLYKKIGDNSEASNFAGRFYHLWRNAEPYVFYPGNELKQYWSFTKDERE
jgi:hypothetical protein